LSVKKRQARNNAPEKSINETSARRAVEVVAAVCDRRIWAFSKSRDGHRRYRGFAEVSTDMKLLLKEIEIASTLAVPAAGQCQKKSLIPSPPGPYDILSLSTSDGML
jgi:hypothetical protein